MKRLIYLLPLLILAAGCFNNPQSEALPDPSGTFTGTYRHISKHVNNKLDTTTANISVVIEPGIGYHVLGDTTKLHAGSKGHYGIVNSGIMFVDSTYPKTGVPTKDHLNGEYVFVYNGSIFQMARTAGDTVAFQYDLKKTN